MDENLLDQNEMLEDHGGYVEVCIGSIQMQLLDGRYILEEDYRVSGEIWQVHKSEVDPYPSKPHAHCIGAEKRFVGLTLHLGTAELFDKRKALGRKLETSQFARLIAQIQPKFPKIKLPLET